MKNRIYYFYYWAKDCLFPHNVIKIKTLPRSYSDPREKLLHAAFAMLVQYVEKESHIVDWPYMTDVEGKICPYRVGEPGREHREASKRAYDTMMDLYQWWTAQRPMEQARLDEIYDVEEEMRLDDKDDAQLRRLADIRQYLWS